MLDLVRGDLRSRRAICSVLPYGILLLGFAYFLIRPALASVADRNKTLVLRALDAQDRGDWALMSELYSPDFLLHSSLTPQPLDWDAFQVDCRMAHTKYPGLVFATDDIIAEGDKVVLRLGSTVRSVPSLVTRDNPDGILAVAEIDIFRIEDGRIVEGWVELDRIQFAHLLMLKGYSTD